MCGCGGWRNQRLVVEHVACRFGCKKNRPQKHSQYGKQSYPIPTTVIKGSTATLTSASTLGSFRPSPAVVWKRLFSAW